MTCRRNPEDCDNCDCRDWDVDLECCKMMSKQRAEAITLGEWKR